MAAITVISRVATPGPYWGPRGRFQPISVDAVMLAGSDNAAALEFIPAKANHTIFVTKLVLTVTTSAAQALAFHDSSSTPVQISAFAASLAVGAYTQDFGEDGIGLTEGKAFQGTWTKGVAGIIHIEAYYRQTATGTP